MNQVVTLDTPGGNKREFYHRGSPADIKIVEHIFRNQDYSLHRLKRGREFWDLFCATKKPLILDSGANIGASAVWFALNFPGSHVVAVEPDPENFEFLIANVAGLDVDARRAAIGSIDGTVSIVDPGAGEWGYRTSLDPQGTCELLSMTRLIKLKIAGGYNPFLVKVDIEGGEDNLFQHQTDWVGSLPVLVVELHDWLMPKMGTSRNFIKCVAQHDRDFVLLGENVFSLRN